MTVAEYRSEFVRLERFARGICATEADRARRFQDGLDIEILRHIAATTFLTLTAVVDAATRQEVILLRQGKCEAVDQGEHKKQHTRSHAQRLHQDRADE